VKSGEAIDVQWFHVTKKPSKSFAGAYGHDYRIKADNLVRFWLIKDGRDWTIIYNSKGAEVVKPRR
jgi:hypothetical protein